MNCCVVPSGIVADGGPIAIETRAAAVTVNPVLPATVPTVALMFAVPIAALLPSPPAETLATAASSEAHAAVAVRSIVLPSEKIPVATNCCAVPSAINGFAGLIVIVSNTAGVMVNVVLAVMFPELAAIVLVPAATAVATPWLPLALLTLATVGALELHTTLCVTVCMVPSVKLPVAANGCVIPDGIEGMAGVNAKETNCAGVTVNPVVPTMAPDVADTVVLPTAMLVASPRLFTDAIVPSAVLQATCAVISRVLPSEYVPVAANCCIVPSAKLPLAGLTASDTRVGAAVTVSAAEPETVPTMAVIDALPAPTPLAKPLLTFAIPDAEEVQDALAVTS